MKAAKNYHIMRYVILLFIIMTASCKSNRQLALPDAYQQSYEIVKMIENDFVITKSVEIQTGKQIELKTDPTGKYYVVTSPGDKTVFRIRVNQNLKEPLPDSAQEYTLLFQTDNPVKSFTKKDEELQEINAVYGFHAFNPKSGYYPLREGTISLKVNKKVNTINIIVELPDEYGKMLNGIYMVSLKDTAEK